MKLPGTLHDAPVLGEFELLVLLALLRIGNGAFGAGIRREIEERTSRELAESAVYVTLQRLEDKHLVCSYEGDPGSGRGGRRRRHYLLLDQGRRALARAVITLEAMTEGLHDGLQE
ncbi:MAG TPA: helix-turn-helix transcriptional regulator [Vicinamibacterales bacterium]|nr:helix-turn-helix transcriptional regulator [Vicinamibacterales bacterium]